MDNKPSIGTRLRELRAEKEKSCQGVVLDMKRRGLDISRELLDKWERDQRVPNGEAVVKLAEYYGTTTDYLLGYQDIKLSVDHYQITADTLGLSIRAVENLIAISSKRGGGEADVLSAILESPQLPTLLSALLDSQNAIARQIRYFEQREAGGTLSRVTLATAKKEALDLSDMYVLRAERKTEPLLREVLGYDELEREVKSHD